MSTSGDDVSEYLSVYLGDPGRVPGIGPERGRRPLDGIARLKSPHGSVRYVWYEAGRPLAALQVVTRDGRHATIANVYTTPSHRRRGLADALLERARRDFGAVAHAEEGSLSAAGRAWRDQRSEGRRLDADIEKALHEEGRSRYPRRAR